MHSYYWRCSCTAEASDDIMTCVACGKAQPKADVKCEEQWKKEPISYGLHETNCACERSLASLLSVAKK